MHPYDPASSAAFTSEGDLDAQDPQKGLRAPQAAGERPGAFGPAAVFASTISAAIGTGPQKVGGASPPRAALGHDLTHASGDRVGIDDALDRSSAVCRIGA